MTTPRYLKGWRLVGTGKWWPAKFGQPPAGPGLTWVPIYEKKSPPPSSNS